MEQWEVELVALGGVSSVWGYMQRQSVTRLGGVGRRSQGTSGQTVLFGAGRSDLEEGRPAGSRGSGEVGFTLISGGGGGSVPKCGSPSGCFLSCLALASLPFCLIFAYAFHSSRHKHA